MSKNPKKSFDFINNVVDKKALNKLLSKIYLEYGTSKTAYLADCLKNLGFKYATKAGTTISIDDLDIPPMKKELIENAEKEIDKSSQRYFKGEITEVERYTKVIDTWSETTEKLTQSVIQNFKKTNPVYMMAFSGARGNISQVSQLVGMRGLMADAQGQIIDLPIKANFTEGLSVTEYIISSYGARKGLVDTALKTADSGYLTRRLVDVAQDVIIREKDCGTEEGIEIETITDAEKEIVSLTERLLGRTIIEDVKDKDGNIAINKNTILSENEINIVRELEIKKIKIRSPLTCRTEHGICQHCYGWALTNNRPVDIGEAIGIIAAQSIGEPGTQLTMRTFHTGGVFRGAGSIRQIVAKNEGKVLTETTTRELRTRHGDIVNVASKQLKLEIEDDKGKKNSYTIPHGATLFVKKGDTIKKGNPIAEYDPSSLDGSGRLTEKATKDITSDVGGKILFEGFNVDEKRDRQGNISRTANRGGKIWVLAGDVYGLPGNSTILVKNEQEVKPGEIIAETTTLSDHGGEVRIPDDLELEETELKGKKIKKIVGGKEITVVIASLTPKNAVLETTKKEQLWRVEGTDETYIVKSPVDTIVENGMVIAELIEEENKVTSSGEIRYDGIEVDENQIITSPGKIIFIPEEIHQISKDSSLKMVETGTYVVAGTEVVKDVRTHIDGIVEIKENNNIIQEVIVRPGELVKVDDINTVNVEDGEIVEKGTEITKGVKAKEKSIINFINYDQDYSRDMDMDDEESEEAEQTEAKAVEILIRSIQEYEIGPKDVNIEFESTETDLISMVSVTQLQYRDGARIRQLEGANLTRTSLVVQMEGYLSHLKGLVELYPGDAPAEEQNLKLVVLENLIVRRETEAASREKTSLQTELLVESGQFIEPKTPISKTQVLVRNAAKVSLKEDPEGKEVRRIFLITPDSYKTITLKTNPVVKENDLISIEQVISESGEKAAISGKIVNIKGKELTVHIGRPYLISVGTQLQAEDEGLVQRGDLLATLVFERQKTGDIVQGLPRVEELLEARKPKESAILAEENGEIEIEHEEDAARLYIVTENGRQEIKIPVDSNIIVSDKQKIIKGQPLTGGPLNPHDVIRLSGVNDVQKYLVDEVQRVYRSQGVEIADKHVEVIVRQMTKKVKVDESGDTKLLPGELTEAKLVEQENEKIAEMEESAPAEYTPVLLGITKASLNTESFISAASFQETTRVLTEAAVEGKKDVLRGLKENVIIGRLIPAGTGHYHLTHTSEDQEEEERKRRLSKAGVRKPSAILEEIEGMFGAPEFSMEESSSEEDYEKSPAGFEDEMEEDEMEDEAQETYSDNDDFSEEDESEEDEEE